MTPQEGKEILAIYRFNLIQSMSNQLEGDIEAIDMAIKALEPTSWIPVSERLPDTVDDYLVTIEYKGEIEGVDVATYRLGGYFDSLWDPANVGWTEGPSEYRHVTAWMPLPEPYKEEGDNNE